MRNRTTVEQGITFRQIVCEVYLDVVGKYSRKKYDVTTGRSLIDTFNGDIIGAMDYNGEFKTSLLRSRSSSSRIYQIRTGSNE